MARSTKAWLALALALALLAAPALAKHHGEDGDDDGGDDDGGDDDGKHSGKGDKYPGKTTDSLGGKWPITKGVLGCIEYDSDAEECTECLEPYFELNDGVCDCSAGYGLAPFAFGKSHKGKLMVCAPCPQGTYSDGGSYSTTLCERCPIGSTTPGDTTESSDDCSICQSGFAGSPPEEKCKLCAAGTYADPDDNAECTDCPDGFTTPKAGATSEDECYIAVCEEDEQSVKGKCYECAEGWSSEKGHANFGKYQPKCYKDGKDKDFKDAHVKTGGLWHDKEGTIPEPKEHDKEAHIPDWEDAKAPKWAGKEDKHKDKHGKGDDDGGDDDGDDDDGGDDDDKKKAATPATPAAAPVKA